jgi:hypothetical protein
MAAGDWPTLIPTAPQDAAGNLVDELYKYSLLQDPVRRRIRGITLQLPGRDLGSIIRSLQLTAVPTGMGGATFISTAPTLTWQQILNNLLQHVAPSF